MPLVPEIVINRLIGALRLVEKPNAVRARFLVETRDEYSTTNVNKLAKQCDHTRLTYSASLVAAYGN